MKKLSPTRFTRMSGAGNTFVIADLIRSEGFPYSPSRDLAKVAAWLCRGFTGFYSDGAIFLKKEADGESDFSWEFFNADGSRADMCGNAARCVSLYYYHQIEKKEHLRLQTRAGTIESWILDGETGFVKVKMPPITKFNSSLTLSAGGKKNRVFFVDTGVPHVVVQDEPNEELAKELRMAPELGPEGANVTFVELMEDGDIQAVTFERGVEGFTLSCGTGAIAAAAFHLACYPEGDHQIIEMPGGDLEVHWEGGTPYLTGPAELEFEFSLFEDHL